MAEERARAVLARGEPARAVGLLFAAYGEEVRRYCARVLRDPSLAEDVQQEVFEQALVDITRFGHRATLKRWLLAIARHRCLDLARRRQRMSALRPILPAQELAEELLIGRERQVVVHRGLQALPSAERELLLLHYVEGLSYDQLAEQCQQSAVTLRVRALRARRALREIVVSSQLEERVEQKPVHVGEANGHHEGLGQG